MTTAEHKKLIFDTCLSEGVEDTLQIAYVLATAGVESGWNLETNPTNMFRLSSNSATPISMMVTHARFKKVPLNGTFISNL